MNCLQKSCKETMSVPRRLTGVRVWQTGWQCRFRTSIAMLLFALVGVISPALADEPSPPAPGADLVTVEAAVDPCILFVQQTDEVLICVTDTNRFSSSVKGLLPDDVFEFYLSGCAEFVPVSDGGHSIITVELSRFAAAALIFSNPNHKI
jgi:hypothetical protein